MKKNLIKKLTIISAIVLVLALSGCNKADTTASAEDALSIGTGTQDKTVSDISAVETQADINGEYSLTITTPSEDNLPMNLQRDFYVGGDIISDSEVPEDAQVTVQLYDASGNEVRSVASVCKGNSNLWAFHENMYFSQEDDPERASATKYLAPEFVVADMNDPNASFTDASIKCTFDDKQFRALIVYATDKEHGLMQDNEIGFVNHDGSPIDGLPEGEYTLKVALLDGKGNTLAHAEKVIELANPEGCILGRFHPDENYEKLMEMREEYDLAGNIDWIPGFVPTDNGDTNGFRAMFANNDLAIYAVSKTHALIYYVEPASSSYRLELAFLQYAQRVGNPDTFQAYHYDIGEPLVRYNNDDSNELEGKIVPFAQGDYMDLCRVDIVDTNTPDNIYALDGKYNQKSYTDFSQVIEIEAGQNFAVSGVLCPFQLDEEDTAKTEDGLYKTKNCYGRIVYTIDDGEESYQLIKSPTMIRYNSALTAQAAICNYEFYNVFTADCFDQKDKTYKITLQAYDYNNEPIDGASESFSIHVK